MEPTVIVKRRRDVDQVDIGRVSDVCEAIARRIETEVLPVMLRRPVVRTATSPECACAAYVAVVEHAARIAREIGESWNP